MRIDINDPSGIGSSATAGSQKVRTTNDASSKAAKQGEIGAGQDQVQLSSVANRVNSSDHVVSAERSANIEQLTKLVQSGQYNPDPAKLADSMIGDMVSNGSWS